MTTRRSILLEAVTCLAFSAPGCGVQAEGIPEGKLAVVGETVLGPEDLAGVQSQLGAYAQLRFRGREGNYALLESLVVTELLAQEAVDHDMGDDPRVRFAVLEEIATLYLNAELQRRVPYEEVEADTAALRAYYDAHPEELTVPERRNARGVLFRHYEPAQQALFELEAKATTLEALGEVVSTPLQRRDDREYPAFHPLLFDPSRGAGELLAEPVVVGERVLVGRVDTVEPAHREPFDDPAVRERLVHAVRAPRLAEAREAVLAELRERYPATDIPR